MLLTFYKSKINQAKVTQTELLYEGSITIDRTIMDAANILANERVQVLNLNNGERFETYVIEGEADSGVICLNGPAARCAIVGDMITIISYVTLTEEESKTWKPTVVSLGENNKRKA